MKNNNSDKENKKPGAVKVAMHATGEYIRKNYKTKEFSYRQQVSFPYSFPCGPSCCFCFELFENLYCADYCKFFAGGF